MYAFRARHTGESQYPGMKVRSWLQTQDADFRKHNGNRVNSTS